MDNIEIINTLITVENRENFPNKIYNNVYDKYTNGHCEDLVMYLYMLNNNTGTKIKVEGLFYEYEDDFDAQVIHFIYKSLDGLYYDINGEFNSIEELIENSFLIDEITSIKEIIIQDTFGLENNENFLNLKSEINSISLSFDR